MKTVRSVPVLVLLALLAACDPGGVELETRTFRLENLAPSQAGSIVQPYVYDDREGSPGMMTVAEGALTVRETEDNLERIARVLEEFDRGSGELRLHFQVIEANGGGASDPAISAVEEELRRLFRFEAYRLVGEGVVSVAQNAEFQQRLLGGEAPWQVTGTVLGAADDAVRLEGVRLWGPDPIFETSVNIRSGQTLVLGSARGGEGEAAVILVVRAEGTS